MADLIKFQNSSINDSDNERYCKNIITTMLNQIHSAIGTDALLSWGMEHITASLYKTGEGSEARLTPCLRFHVNGLIHQGWVMVAYIDDVDLYTVLIIDEDMQHVKEKFTHVFGDQLGALIDAHVERDPSLTDDEYYEQANAATIAAGLPPLPPKGRTVEIRSIG